MADTLRLEVVTPERAVLSESVDDVVLPGELGQMDVLPGHLPLLTLLGVGELIMRQGGQERYFLIDSGYAEIVDDTVTVLTVACDGVNDIDIEQARRLLAEAEEELSQLEESSRTEEVEESLFEQRRAVLRRRRMRVAFAEEHPGS